MTRFGWAAAALVLVASTSALAGDSPQISRSLGKKDGIVVLWPRVAATSEVPEGAAATVQAALARLAESTGVAVDVRPDPERVCPRETGCRAVALGAVITGRGGGCAVVATVSAPGTSPAMLLPWVAQVRFQVPSVPFREPPESQVVVTDFAGCDTLAAELEADVAGVKQALRAALGG